MPRPRRVGEQDGRVLRDRALQQQIGEGTRAIRPLANDDTAWMAVVMQRAPLAQEFGREYYVFRVQRGADLADETNRHR